MVISTYTFPVESLQQKKNPLEYFNCDSCLEITNSTINKITNQIVIDVVKTLGSQACAISKVLNLKTCRGMTDYFTDLFI